MKWYGKREDIFKKYIKYAYFIITVEPDVIEKEEEKPEEVVTTETETDDAIVVELKVDPSDMGKVIGRQGRIAKAIRAVVKAASSKSDKKVVVEILQ